MATDNDGKLPKDTKFPCTQCGICCKTTGRIQEGIRRGITLWTPTKLAGHGFYDYNKTEAKRLEEEIMSLPLKEDQRTCGHLSDDGPPYTCGIYESRPLSCRLLGNGNQSNPWKPKALTDKEWLMSNILSCNIGMGAVANAKEVDLLVQQGSQEMLDTEFYLQEDREGVTPIDIPENLQPLVVEAYSKYTELINGFGNFLTELKNKSPASKRKRRNRTRSKNKKNNRRNKT